MLAAIAARAAEHDRDGSFPFEAFDALFPTGALRLTIPVEHGGLGRGLAAATELVVDVGAADPSVALVLAQHSLFHAGLGEAGWPDGRLAPVRTSAVEGVALINALRVEPDLGTPARGGLPATVAARLPDGAGWRLTGRKIYSTGIPLLRWLLVYARTDDPEPLVGNVLVEAGTPGVPRRADVGPARHAGDAQRRRRVRRRRRAARPWARASRRRRRRRLRSRSPGTAS